MTPAELLKPILGGGIRSVNFFNGRLLSGEDMSREQEANREAHKMLGKAIGDGIAYGLEVSRAAGPATNAIVTVQPGLAINRNGETLRLSSPISLSLVRPQNGSGIAVDAGFSSCTPFQSGVYVSGSGVYLLTVCPVRATAGRAAVTGLQNSAADCNTKYLVDGVQFRLIQLGLTASELSDQNHLRNLVAYKCFGVADAKSFITDPFGPQVTSGLLDDLRPNRLTDCDVPLAVLHWTASDGIKFVDNWSVRRRIATPSAHTQWKTAMSDRRSCLIEAMMLQFADQLRELELSRSDLESLSVTRHFNYLPPVGLLPVSRLRFGGVIINNFFSAYAHREPEFIDGKLLRVLLKEAVHHEPIDLSQGEMVWLYKGWQNEQVFVKNESVQPYVIFASAQIPYLGGARFDVARWDLSNYARCEDC